MEKAIIMSFPQIVSQEVKIENAGSSEHGDYACNIAMHLTKTLQMSPKEIAEKIIMKKIKEKARFL